MLYACIFVPDFPVQAILRAEPELRDYAVVVLDGHTPVQRPLAMNEHARRKGVQPAMPKTLLEQCSSLLLRPRSPQLESKAHLALVETAKFFSPRIEELADNTLLLDLAGMDQLFGPPERLARELARRLEAIDLIGHIAVAANTDAALATARGRAGITIIPSGREAELLGSLPLTVLDPPAEMLETLDAWGIRDFRGLAALPTAELSERLGQAGVRLQRRARGQSQRALIGAEPVPEFIAQIELEYPVEELDPLAFVFNRLLGDICARLQAYSFAANQLDVYLDLQPIEVVTQDWQSVEVQLGARRPVPGTDLRLPGCGSLVPSTYQKSIHLPVPTRDPHLLLNLLRMQLEAQPPAAPIVRITLEAMPAAPRVGQGGLFAPLAPDPQKLQVTLARIEALVGKQNVGSPRLVDSHQPGSFTMQPFAMGDVAPGFSPAPSRSARNGTSPAPPRQNVAYAALKGGSTEERLALRIYRPPVLAAVSLKHDVPEWLSFRDVRGRVVAAGGPWRTSGGWWQSDAWQYDDWDVEIVTACSRLAGCYRIYLDRIAEKWFVRGEYD